MSGMYGQWCVVLNISTFGGQLIKFISFKNLCSILKDYLKMFFNFYLFEVNFGPRNVRDDRDVMSGMYR